MVDTYSIQINIDGQDNASPKLGRVNDELDDINNEFQLKAEEIKVLKEYCNLDNKNDQELKIKKLKEKQSKEIKKELLKDNTQEEQIKYMTKKLHERAAINKLNK